MFWDTKGVFSSRLKKHGSGCSKFLKDLFPLQRRHSLSLFLIEGNTGVSWELRWNAKPLVCGSGHVWGISGKWWAMISQENCGLRMTLSSFDELCDAIGPLGAPIFIFKVYGNATSHVLIVQLILSHFTDLSIPSTKISDSSQSRYSLHFTSQSQAAEPPLTPTASYQRKFSAG